MLQLVNAVKLGTERLLIRWRLQLAVPVKGLIPVYQPFQPLLNSRRRPEQCSHLSVRFDPQDCECRQMRSDSAEGRRQTAQRERGACSTWVFITQFYYTPSGRQMICQNCQTSRCRLVYVKRWVELHRDEDCIGEVRPLEICAIGVCLSEVCVSEVYPFEVCLGKVCLAKLHPVEVSLGKVCCDKAAPRRSASARFAPRRSAPRRSALRMVALERFVLERSAHVRFASARFAPWRSASGSLAPGRSALARFALARSATQLL